MRKARDKIILCGESAHLCVRLAGITISVAYQISTDMLAGLARARGALLGHDVVEPGLGARL